MPYNDLIYIAGAKKHSLVRDEIEEIINTKNIDRTKFREYSKTAYGDIISKFYFTFADIKNYPVGRQTLDADRMHFRQELSREYIACSLNAESHREYMQMIKSELPHEENKLLLIFEDGWVYEGEKDTMFSVLEDMSFTGGFFIVSPKFSWFTAVRSINDNACLYRR